MAADPVDPEALAGLGRNAPLTRPRPGHADLAGMQRYGFDEARPVLERASARETAARVALGTVARSYLKGDHRDRDRLARGRTRRRQSAGRCARPSDVARLDADPVRCLDPDASKAMVAEIDQAHQDGDTLGGVVEVVAHGVPVGARVARPLGPAAGLPAGGGAHGDPGDQGRRTGRRIRAGASAGLEGARRDRPVGGGGLRRSSGRSGGTEGGLSTGELLRVRAAMKPIATVPRALATVDVPQARRPAHTTSARTCARCRRQGSWPRRWWRWCWRTRWRRIRR